MIASARPANTNPNRCFWCKIKPALTRFHYFGLQGDCRRRGSQGRVFATGNEGIHRVHSATPPSESPQSAALSLFGRPERFTPIL